MIGQLLQSRYQVIRALGKGAFGQTYLAQDTQYPGKPYCVVKHLQPDDPRSLERAKEFFAKEANTLAKLGKHDQIPELKAHSETQFYLVQEFIDGHPLRDEMPPSSPQWAENQVISLLQDILPVLVFIHDEGVIHRDIKPDNIMRRRRDNKLVLIDFGAIKEKVLNSPGAGGSTVAGSVIHTAGYAPTEQLLGKPKFNSDIHALGMTAIEALTGKYPYTLPQDDNTDEIIWQDKASVSPSLAAILTKMVRYSHRERYQSAGEVLQALQQLMQASQTQATGSSGVVNQLTLEWVEAGQVRNTTIRDNQQSKNLGTVRIGRDPVQCDIVFSDLTVSGLHVEIFFNQQQRQFYVRNLRQTNPPIVDGRPLPTGETMLSQGSNVQLGQINLRVTAITLGQAGRVAPTQLATNTQPTELATNIKPTEVATAYQSSTTTSVTPTENPAANNKLDNTQTTIIGQLLQGRYQFIRELDYGTFGQTYLAQDIQYPGKPYCVVKHLQPNEPRNFNSRDLRRVKQLFIKEVELRTKWRKHDQIPELKAHSETEFYLVQEFIEGHLLQDEMPPSTPQWMENQVISLLRNILPILVFIHDAGVIHRNITPRYIMRRQRDNKLVLIDFSTITEKVLNTPGMGTQMSVGVLGYMPEEQSQGKPEFNSDIYALGMTAIQALTGEAPFNLNDLNTNEIIWQDKASVSPGLAGILTKMVRYSHRERYQSAGEVLQALQQLT
jgi:serine/threonine-protein kinase